MKTRRSPRRAVALAAVLALAIGGAPLGVASAQPDPLQHLDMAYVEEVTEHLATIGSSSLGFRAMATLEDQESAQYLAGEMTAIASRASRSRSSPGTDGGSRTPPSR